MSRQGGANNGSRQRSSVEVHVPHIPCSPVAVAPLPPPFKQCGQYPLFALAFRERGTDRNPWPIAVGSWGVKAEKSKNPTCTSPVIVIVIVVSTHS